MELGTNDSGERYIMDYQRAREYVDSVSSPAVPFGAVIGSIVKLSGRAGYFRVLASPSDPRPAHLAGLGRGKWLVASTAGDGNSFAFFVAEDRLSLTDYAR